MITKFLRWFMGTSLVCCLAGSVCLAADVEEDRLSSSGKYQPAFAEKPVEGGATGPAELVRSLTVEKEEDGTFRIGEVVIDPAARTVTLPARVNMREHVIEYALVNKQGKVHEALLVTDVRPAQVQVAALLLGMASNKVDEVTDLQDPTRRIEIEVTWARNGPPALHKLNELIELHYSGEPGELDPERPFPEGPWVYNGSYFSAYGFAAEREGSLIALIGDGSALMNQTGKSIHRDDAHHPRTALLPRQNFPVTVVLRFPASIAENAP